MGVVWLFGFMAFWAYGFLGLWLFRVFRVVGVIWLLGLGVFRVAWVIWFFRVFWVYRSPLAGFLGFWPVFWNFFVFFGV